MRPAHAATGNKSDRAGGAHGIQDSVMLSRRSTVENLLVQVVLPQGLSRVCCIFFFFLILFYCRSCRENFGLAELFARQNLGQAEPWLGTLLKDAPSTVPSVGAVVWGNPQDSTT